MKKGQKDEEDKPKRKTLPTKDPSKIENKFSSATEIQTKGKKRRIKLREEFPRTSELHQSQPTHPTHSGEDHTYSFLSYA